MSLEKKFFKFINIFYDPLHNTRKFKGITADRDLIYDDSHAWGKADMVYMGEKTVKRPVFINIHGGGFVSGDKKMRDSIAHRFAEMGFFVYNINYRLAGVSPFFTCTEDSITAINHLHELALDYNLDLDNITLSGDSAGAFIALQIYISSINDDYRKSCDLSRLQVKFKKQVLFCGPYDVEKLLRKRAFLRLNHRILEKACGRKYDKKYTGLEEYKYIKELNLLNYLPEKGYPTIPTFIVFSRIDTFCPGDGERLLKIFQEREFNHQYFGAKRWFDNHCFHLLQFQKISDECLNKVEKFIKEE